MPLPWVFPVLLFLPADASAPTFANHVGPFLAKHCLACHSKEKKKGDLILEDFRDEAGAKAARDVWGNIAKKLRAREMPPKARPQPEPSEVEPVLAWIDASVFGLKDNGPRDPGRVVLRRLNRTEYNYTIRDLVGLDLRLADEFPNDEVGYGFDNIGDVLTLPAILLEKYLTAAERIAEQAINAVPREDSKLPDAHRRIIIARPKDPNDAAERRRCAHEVVERFGGRAFRRTLTPEETDRYAGLIDLAVEKGDTFERGVQLAVEAILVSPFFLYRVELDSDPKSPEAHPLSSFELASRLSYFLWSSIPDDELLADARDDKLKDPQVLEKHVRRMLDDKRSRGFTKTFAAQWLGIRKVRMMTPDRKSFPSWRDDLRDAMRNETEMFFEEIVKKDLSVLTFIDSDFTFVNERLARHYGIEGVKGNDFRRVELKDGRRGGVLTQGTVLLTTSNPTRTSPVKRGKWILEQILGAPPPPPPPEVPQLNEKSEAVNAASLRQRMEQHRARPDCAVCHDKLDPLGFAFENYDGVGAWREKDGKFDIDPSGSLPDGSSFHGVGELKKTLLSRKDEFCRCLAEKTLTFALGRGLEYHDGPAVEGIVKELEKGEYRFSTLILGVVKSYPFQMRRGERAKT